MPFSCLCYPKNKHETLVLKREETAEMQYKSERENEKKLYLQRFFSPQCDELEMCGSLNTPVSLFPC